MGYAAGKTLPLPSHAQPLMGFSDTGPAGHPPWWSSSIAEVEQEKQEQEKGEEKQEKEEK
jgi:hypothetical protein